MLWFSGKGFRLMILLWEKWEELKSLYDLEDKVIVEGDSIDTIGNIRSKRMT